MQRHFAPKAPFIGKTIATRFPNMSVTRAWHHHPHGDATEGSVPVPLPQATGANVKDVRTPIANIFWSLMVPFCFVVRALLLRASCVCAISPRELPRGSKDMPRRRRCGRRRRLLAVAVVVVLRASRTEYDYHKNTHQVWRVSQRGVRADRLAIVRAWH